MHKDEKKSVSESSAEDNMLGYFEDLQDLREYVNIFSNKLNKKIFNINEVLCAHKFKYSQLPSEQMPLNLTENEINSIFKDGYGLEWRIVDFDLCEYYECTARTVSGKEVALFDKFGNKQGCEKDSLDSLVKLA